MSKQSQQADGEIHGNQLLNFLVNSLGEEVDLDLGDNAEIVAEDIYEVPTAWLETIDGLSGHAAANSLLQFARASSADQIRLVHGEEYVAEHLRSHLQSNTEATTITLATTDEAIEIIETGAVADDLERLKARHQDLERELAALQEEIDELNRAWKSD